MTWLRLLFVLALVVTSGTPIHAQRAQSAYEAGLRAEKKQELDAAYAFLKVAHEKKPSDLQYTAAYLHSRLAASAYHIQQGQGLRDVYKLNEALTEFQRAAEIDSSSFVAIQEIRRTVEVIRRRDREANQPPQLKAQLSAVEKAAGLASGPDSLDLPPSSPITLHILANTDVLYQTLGKLAGFNVLTDPELKPQKIKFELKDVSIRDALTMLAMQSHTFWRPVSSNTIMVSADSSGKRKELEQSVMMTFYLENASTPADLQQAATALKTILDISRIQITPEQRSLTVRATPDQIILAERLLQDIDKPKAEVMIEIAVMEVSRGRIRTLGINLPTTISASIQPSGSSASSTTSSLTLGSFPGLTASDIAVSIPGASLSALMSDSNTKVLQKPQLRAMDSEKATLKIGDRIPIATGSYQSGLTNGVNTQFTYIDVGVNVDIIPYIHANHDVTLKMSFEVSSVTGEQSVGGVTEPTIGQRRIEHIARLADGEVNLIGGILQDSDTKSLSGYPLLSRLPLLKYLFAQENKDRQQNEIVFAITPHILRGNEVNEQNRRMIDLGTGTSTTYRTSSVVDLATQPATVPTATPVSAPLVDRTAVGPLGSKR